MMVVGGKNEAEVIKVRPGNLTNFNYIKNSYRGLTFQVLLILFHY